MKHTRGITLVEIMIVLAIIGLLAAIAIPGINEARRKSAVTRCITNLTRISEAKAELAGKSGLKDGDPVDPEALDKHIDGGIPVCPAGGTYTYGAVGVKPECTVPGHVLP
jgi:prepilin-type N-terminal cleavage/methylation domain-containing protein